MIDKQFFTDKTGRKFDISTVYFRKDGSFVLSMISPSFGTIPFHVPNEGEYAAIHTEISHWREQGHESHFIPEPEPDPIIPDLAPEYEAEAAWAEYNSLPNVKKRTLLMIDAATSAAILAGFDYETDPGTGTPEKLHFSYDSFDQQNFSDSAIAMQLGAATASDAIPTSTPWNAYRNYTPETGGELVVLQLTAASFLPLYAAALTHKVAKMAEGSARKALVESADSVEAVQALLARWEL